MVLSLSLSPEAEARLRAKASAAGIDIETYVARHLERLASGPPSVAELSGPIGEAFARSGTTEDQLGEFLETEKHAQRLERRSKRAG